MEVGFQVSVIHSRRSAVFLDLNGTLVMPMKVDDPTEYRALAGAAEAVALFGAAGYICPVVTVQSRIVRGKFTEAAFRTWFGSFSERVANESAALFGPYLCPHRQADGCECMKPKTALYEAAARELRIDLSSSFVVGDSIGDIRAANQLGCRGVAVKTGWPIDDAVRNAAAYVAADVLDAAGWVVRQS